MMNNLLNRRAFFKTVTQKSIESILGISLFSHLACRKSSNKMPHRILGRTNLLVSLLGFGCTQVKDKAVYKRAIELGIDYFHMGDRDPTYNLDACAALLPFREKIKIAYMSHPKDSQKLLLEDLDNFLQQSRLDYLDVWFAITPRPEVLNEFYWAVADARKAGKIQWAGITTHNLDQDVVHLTSSTSPIDVVMMTFNYLSPPDHSKKLDMLHHAGLGITPMKPLAGKFYEKVADKPDPLLRWLAADSRISTIPVIMNSVDQVEENAAAVKQPLSKQDRELLQTMFAYNSQRFCRMCGSCEGECPEGLAVSDLVRTAMYAEGYRDHRLARSHFLAIPAKNRQISCSTCERCTVLCPNGVAVQERIWSLENKFA